MLFETASEGMERVSENSARIGIRLPPHASTCGQFHVTPRTTPAVHTHISRYFSSYAGQNTLWMYVVIFAYLYMCLVCVHECATLSYP